MQAITETRRNDHDAGGRRKRIYAATFAVARNETEETERLLDQAEALFDETDNRTGLARVAEMRGTLLMAKEPKDE